MGEKLIVGPIGKGLKTNLPGTYIDNDSFPTMINAYQWRGRVKRKRGTTFLTHFTRYFDSSSTAYTSTSTITPDGNGDADLITTFSLQANGAIVPESIILSGGGSTYRDTDGEGIFYEDAAPATPVGTINYATGEFTILAAASVALSAIFRYYPNLPVLGLEDFFQDNTGYQKTIGFDTTYAYEVTRNFPADSFSVSWYKNPALNSTLLPNYVRKTSYTPVSWNADDYQQYYTCNWAGAMWATPGVDVPFVGTSLGMPFKAITNVANIVAGPPAQCDLTIASHGLVIGDFVFINEISTASVTGINYNSGYVIAVPDVNTVTVEFPNTVLGGGGGAVTGIAQYLTSRPDTSKDCIRWYDGDPTNGSPTTPIFTGSKGWVNFCPPLSQGSFSVGGLPAEQYYLVGAKIIVPFKDRLMFLGVVVQTSSGSPIYLQDTVVFSEVGTPFYTASFQGDNPLIPTSITPILVPTNQGAVVAAFWSNISGFGGFVTAGLDDPINTVGFENDVLILGFPTQQQRLIYTGNDLVPFSFYLVNNELGSGSTFSAIDMDRGVITRGTRGYILTSQTDAARVDLQIPDAVFEINLNDNGAERVTAVRDYQNEWIYFSYPYNQSKNIFNSSTLQFNYRDNSWAVFSESYTTYGLYRYDEELTWATVGFVYPTWSEWNQPWNSGKSTARQVQVIAGTTQGYVVMRDSGTDESKSRYITSFSGSTITSYNHTLDDGDYIQINGCVGTISEQVNGKIFRVNRAADASDQDTFEITPNIAGGLTYQGNGEIKQLYRPFVQTKQFPLSWELGRKTRLGAQQYLLEKTPTGEISLLIYLSQNMDNAYNLPPIVPEVNSTNNALVYSTLLYTRPETTELGLTPANINLQQTTAIQQEQIWHRINTSLLGDTVQLGFTLSDEQMMQYNDVLESSELTGATQATPCVLTCNGNYPAGTQVKISGIEVGMTELNYTPTVYNIYSVLSSTSTEVTIDVDSSAFTAYDSGGTVQPVQPTIQTEEITLYGFIMDVSPSGMLA